MAVTFAIGMAGAVCAQSGRTMVFRALGQAEGLSQSTVNAILQDSRGFVWLATENGLNRYDGYRVVSYLRDPGDPGALPADFVWDIAEDRDGNLWLATEGAGLVKWSRDSDRFRTIFQFDGDDAAERRLARSIYIGDNGHIWVGTRGAGLIQLDADGVELRQYRQASDWLGDDTVYAVTPTPSGELLIATNGGISALQPATGNSRAMPEFTQRVAVSSILTDSDGGIWIGTFENGLFHVKSGRSTARHYLPASAGLSSDRIRDLHRDAAGRLWVATESGLNLYRPDTDDFQPFRRNPSDLLSLPDDRLMCLTSDDSGLLWIGTRLAGAARWNPRSWSFGAAEPELLRGAAVLAFADAGAGEVWAGGFGMPLVRIDREHRIVGQIGKAQGLPEAPVTALLNGRSGELWIGTMGAGLHRYDPASGAHRAVPMNPRDSSTLAADGIMSLYADVNGTVWAGTFGGGLNSIDPDTLKVTRYPHGASIPGALGSDRATAIVRDSYGTLWVGTDGGGLGRLEPGTGLFVQYRHDPDNAASLGSDTIYALHADPSGWLWIGTAGGGLARLKLPPAIPGRASFEHFTVGQGLASNVINGIRPDAAGRLWLSTNKGISRLEPGTLRVTNFSHAQGLQSDEFNFGAHFRSDDGRLFFGATDGYNAFDPVAVQTNPRPPRLVLTGFEKFNNPVDTDVPLADLREIDLAHDDTVITFEFAALDFAAPERNTYSVKLEGFDRDWSPPSSRQRVTYTNLDPGDYTLYIRAANSDGVWVEEPLELAIRMAAPPWATPQAYAAYAALAALLIFLFFRWRLRVLAQKARMDQLAYYDRVTGLPNRELFEMRLAAAAERAEAGQYALAVICLRIGPLKQLHDSLGYRSLDDGLKTISRRLSQALSAHGSSVRTELARLREDTFMAFVALPDADDESGQFTRPLLDAIAEPLDFDGQRVDIPAWAGIALYPRDSRDPATLVNYADTASGSALSDRKQATAYYNRSMTALAATRLALEGELRHAIENDTLALHLQGKFLVSGELVGAEALIRWPHDRHGFIPPGQFVPLAEESDLIIALDEWVMSQAAAILARWTHHPDAAKLAIAVNISAATFTHGRIIPVLSAQTDAHNLRPERLEIELTETALAGDLGELTQALNQIRILGHGVSLDDFGSGYSSLTYLHKLPIDKLKIDQAFVTGFEDNEDQLALCSAIIAMARSLGLTTVAEGVERESERDLLAKMGCQQVQGYALHKPSSVAEFERQFFGGINAPVSGAGR